MFYDAFLPGLTTRKNYGRVSGYGFAMGYMGSLAILVLVNWMLPPSSDPGYSFVVRLSFALAAAFFLLFSLPLFFFVSEPPAAGPPPPSLLRAGMQRSAATLRLLFVERKYPSLARFLVAFFVYNDGVLTIIAFAALFAERVLQMNDAEIIRFFAVVQTSAIVGSAVFGVLTDKIGPKRDHQHYTPALDRHCHRGIFHNDHDSILRRRPRCRCSDGILPIRQPQLSWRC